MYLRGCTMIFAKNLVAIDFGSSSVKLLSLKKSGSKFSLLKRPVVEPIPRGIINQGHIEKVDDLKSFLSSINKKHKYCPKYKKLSISIGGNAAIVRRIEVDIVKGAGQLGEQIHQAAEQVLSNMNSLYWSYHVLSNYDSSSTSVSVILCAVKVEVVESYISAVKGGLKCKIGVIDTNISSLSNSYIYNYTNNQGLNALLDIGATCSSVVFFDNGVYCYSKIIGIGGDYYTSTISSDLGVDKQRAENIKLSLGQGNSVPSEVGGIINNIHDILASEINQSIDFFAKTVMKNVSDTSIKTLYLSGGGAKIPGLADVIQKSCNLMVDYFNPFGRVGCAVSKSALKKATEQANFYGVGLGVSIRQLDDNS